MLYLCRVHDLVAHVVCSVVDLEEDIRTIECLPVNDIKVSNGFLSIP